MIELDARCLDSFPEWLRALGADARDLASIVEEGRLSDSVLRQCVVAIHYLFKSVDLIPDGIEDLGYIDDAFVLRVTSAGAVDGDSGAAEADRTGVLARLSDGVALLKEFLGPDYGRLAAHIRGLESVSIRGRTVENVLANEETRQELAKEAVAWADAYRIPSFTRDEKTLVKLRSFMHAKLPE